MADSKDFTLTWLDGAESGTVWIRVSERVASVLAAALVSAGFTEVKLSCNTVTVADVPVPAAKIAE